MNPIPAFPLFEENQVLSAEHLSRLGEHLRTAGLDTRRLLVGVGVVTGLEVAATPAGLRLGRGLGVTTAGHLAWAERDETFTRARRYTLPPGGSYAPFLPGGVQLELWEAFTPGPGVDPGQPLDAALLAGRIALLFAEEVTADLDRCLDNHCLNQGKELRLTWRLLLAREADAAALRAAALAGALPDPAGRLPDARLPRLHLTAANTAAAGPLRQAALDALRAARDALLPAVQAAAALLAHPLGLSRAAALAAEAGLRGRLDALLADFAAGRDPAWPHALDHARHLALAYGELAETAWDTWPALGASGLPAADPAAAFTPFPFEPFPRHLLLGPAPTPGRGPLPALRHGFVASPALTLGGRDRARLRHALERLLTLAAAFRTGPARGVRVTPGAALDQPLARQAVPFYYEPAAVLPAWSLEATARGRERTLPCHHLEELDPAAREPLRHRDARARFFRVEGHLGRPRREVEAALEAARRGHNLPFAVLTAGFGAAAGADEACACELDGLRVIHESAADELRCHLKRLLGFLGRVARPVRPDASIFRRVPGAETARFVFAVENLNFFTAAGQRAAAAAGGAATTALNPGLAARVTGTAPRRLGFDYVKLDPQIYDRFEPVPLVNALARELVGLLNDADDQLTAVLDEFEAAAFQQTIAAARAKATDLRDRLTTLLAADPPRLQPTGAEQALLQELVIFLANCVPTRVLRNAELFAAALAKLKLTPALATLLAEHPGLEHLGGVPAGGTLVLVVAPRGAPAPAPPRSAPVADAFAAPAAVRTAGSHARKGGGTVALLEAFAGAAHFSAADQAAAAAVKQELEADIAVITPDFRKLLEELRRKFGEPAQPEDEDIVVADFCLPYVCCSGCGCVTQIVLPPPAEPPPPPVRAALPQAEFCADDRREFPFTVEPPVGVVAGPGVQRDAAGAFVFVPAAAGVTGAVTFTYTAPDGRTATVNATVARPPEPAFEFAVDPGDAVFVVVFRNATPGEAEFTWDFGDGETAAGRDVTHTYREPGRFTVRLTARRGPCTAAATREVVLEREPPPPAISLPADAFCANDRRPQPVTANPPGGVVEGPGVQRDATGGFVFVPAAAGATGAVTLAYTLPDGRRAEAAVTLVPPPGAAFDFQLVQVAGGVAVQFLSRADTDAALRWDFGDGGTSDEVNPVHRYATGGVFRVRLRATRGPCTALATREVEAPGRDTPPGPVRPEVRFRADGLPALREDARFAAVIGSDRTAAVRGVSRLHAVAAAAAAEPARAAEFDGADGEARLAEAVTPALTATGRKLADAEGLAAADALLTWAFAQQPLEAALALALAREGDLAADGALAGAMKEYAAQLATAHGLPRLRRLEYTGGVAALLEDAAAEEGRPVLRGLAEEFSRIVA
jgi:PKD repeat protein